MAKIINELNCDEKGDDDEGCDNDEEFTAMMNRQRLFDVDCLLLLLFYQLLRFQDWFNVFLVCRSRMRYRIVTVVVAYRQRSDPRYSTFAALCHSVNLGLACFCVYSSLSKFDYIF